MSDNAKEKRENSQKSGSENISLNVKCDNCEIAPSELTCPKCEENFCRICDEKRHATGKAREHKRVPYLGLTKVPSRFCNLNSHNENPLILFCTPCKKTLCSICSTKHKSHNCISLSSAAEEIKIKLTQTFVSVQVSMKKTEAEIQRQEIELKKIKDKFQLEGKLLEDTKELISKSGLEAYIFLSMYSDSKIPIQFDSKSIQSDIKSHTMLNSGFTTDSAFTWSSKKGRNVTLSNNNFTARMNGKEWQGGLILGAREFKQGDQYWEVKIDTGYDIMIGVATPLNPERLNFVHTNYPTEVWFLYHSGALFGGEGSIKGNGQPFTTGDIIGVYLSWKNEKEFYEMTYYRNGNRLGTFFKGIYGPVVAAVELHTSTDRVTLNSKAKRPDS